MPEALSPSRSSLIHPLGLTEGEKRDLIAFLNTLTGDPAPFVYSGSCPGRLFQQRSRERHTPAFGLPYDSQQTCSKRGAAWPIQGEFAATTVTSRCIVGWIAQRTANVPV